ncbi:FAD-dependent oxidoreductase [Actinoplanes sp. NPDC000266]
MSTPSDRTAVVIGASMAGLMAAQALHSSFDHVVVLDRDSLPDEPVPRHSVPQSAQVHGLLARGKIELDRLFAGLSDELSQLGAPNFDIQDDLQWWVDGRPLMKALSGVSALGVSRPLLEVAIRRRVRGLPNLEVLPEHVALELLTTADNRRVTGVRASSGDGMTTTFNDVDLVVDASGRSSRSRHWLRAMGYPEVEQETVESQVTYVSRRYRREPDQLDGWTGIAASVHPGTDRSGFALAQEDDSWIVGITGWFGIVPPTDDEGMAAYADTLVSPALAALIRTATPLGEPRKMRFPSSTRLRFDRLARVPQGLVIIGDAMCSFNPVYAQGITVAALQAIALRQLAQTADDDVSERYFAETVGVVDQPWTTMLSSDLRFPQAIGDRSMLDPVRGAYMARLRAAAAEDAKLATAFLRVAHMIDPLSALTAPEAAARVPR